MKQLSGFDAGFLYSETPTLHMHTLKVGVIDPSGFPGGYSFERFYDTMAAYLHLLPAFRRRVVEIPFGLGHPVWIEDPDFDLRRHLSRRVADAPGDTVELCRIVSEIAGTPLSRDKPLWEIVAVEGLEGGRVGFVAKIHHCVADGTAALEMLLNIMREDRDVAVPPPPTEPWRPEPIPGSRQLLLHAFRVGWKRWLNLPRLLLRTLRGVVAVLRYIRGHPVDAPRPFQNPITSFNHALGPERVFATCSLRLEDLKAIRRATDATLNDVVLAVCGGALRRYLADRGELPEQSLVAGVPVNTAPGEHGRLSGNRVGNVLTTLRTDLADPAERLRAIHEVMEDAKQRQAVLGRDMLESWVEFAPPRPYSSVMRLLSSSRIADRVHPPFNLIISNVPGPRKTLYLQGARLVALHSVGPIMEGISLNITAWSYAGEMQFNLLACPRGVPDPWKLLAYLPEALAELSAAILPAWDSNRIA